MVDTVKWSCVAMLPAIMFGLYEMHFLTVLPAASFLAAWNYHKSHETNYTHVDLFMAYSTLVYGIMWSVVVDCKIPTRLDFVLLGMAAMFHKIPDKRHLGGSRKNYVVPHTFFHLTVSWLMFNIVTNSPC